MKTRLRTLLLALSLAGCASDPAAFDWREHMDDPSTTAGQRLRERREEALRQAAEDNPMADPAVMREFSRRMPEIPVLLDRDLWDADTLDRSLIGPDAGAAPGSGSQFEPRRQP